MPAPTAPETPVQPVSPVQAPVPAPPPAPPKPASPAQAPAPAAQPDMAKAPAPAQPKPAAPAAAKPGAPPAPGGQLSAPKNIKPSKGINARNCTIAGVIFGILAFIGLAYLISELGLIKVPFFSQFYEGPKPARVIQAGILTWEDFQKNLTDHIYVQYTQEGSTYGIELKEQELTDLLTTVVGNAVRNESWRVLVSQIAIEPDCIELLMKIEWGWFAKLDFMICFKPVVDDKNAVHFETTEAQFGDFRIPPDWGMYIGSYLFNRDLGTWEIRIGNRSVIRSVTLREGAIDLILNR